MLTLPLQQHLPPVSTAQSASSMTASVAVLPSAPLALPQLSKPSPLGPNCSSRPKLALDTTPLRVYGRKGGTSSLRLDTLSAISPTVRNTYQNSSFRSSSSPSSTAPAPLPATGDDEPQPSTTTTTIRITTDIPSRISPQREDSSASSASTSSSLEAEPYIPYLQPAFLKPILRNTRRPRRETRSFSFSTTRPMFPSPKRVCFRHPLAEDIFTVRFTMRHSDLDECEEEEPVAVTCELPEQAERTASPGKRRKKLGLRFDVPPPALRTGADATSPRTGEKRESSSEEEEDSDENCANTPVAGRKKRRREWVWTLGPVDGELGDDVHIDTDGAVRSDGLEEQEGEVFGR